MIFCPNLVFLGDRMHTFYSKVEIGLIAEKLL